MEDFERTKVVSVVRVKRKRGSAEAAEVLFLQGKDEEEEEDERKGNNNAGTDTNGTKRSIKKNSCYNTSNNRNTIKNIKNDDFIKGRYDRELAAQLDAVLGGGSQALPSHRNSRQTTKTKEGEGDFDEDEKKTKKKKSNGMLKKFVRLTREAGMEQNDARDAQTVKTLLESRRERRKGEDGGGGKTTKASTRTTTKRTYEEVKVIMGEDESMKSMATTRRDHNITEEQRKKRNVLSSSSTTTDSTKEVFYCYDILCRDEEEEKIEEEEKEKEGKEEGNRNDEKIELEDQILMNYMPMVKEYTEKKKREEEDADGNWVYDLYVLEQDDVVPKREGGTVETDDIICEEPIVRVSDFLDNANVEHNLHENEYFSEDDSEDSNAENYYRGDYPEEDTDDDDGFFDDGGDDSDRDEWDVDDEYDSDEEDDGYGRHRSDHGSGWGV